MIVLRLSSPEREEMQSGCSIFPTPENKRIKSAINYKAINVRSLGKFGAILFDSSLHL